MLCEAVKNYISEAKGLPFFYVVGDDNYASVLSELTQSGIKKVRVSDFCSKDDKFPSVDELIDFFRTSDVDYRDNKFVVVGLGEYLALKGALTANSELARLKSTTLGNARVILLLRGVKSQVISMVSNDTRMLEQQRVVVQEPSTSCISITNIISEGNMDVSKGVKKLLQSFEDGAKGNCIINSSLDFSKSIFPIHTISSSYEILKMYEKDFKVSENLGFKEYWGRLLKDYLKCNKTISVVLERYGISDDLEDFYNKITGDEYKNWLYFITLKLNSESQTNMYLKYVLDNTNDFEQFRNNIITCITNIRHNQPNFLALYYDRKRLVRDFPDADISLFIQKNSIEPKESIYRLTDNTLIERKTIISWIAKYGLISEIDYIYPALTSYLKKYVFDTPILSQELTRYFDQYKKQKVTNTIDDNFIALVEQYASEYKYAKLQTRDSVINCIADKHDTFLYWIDALGVEYLSYIADAARRRGLSLHIEIARADLPTITSINKQFYDEWNGKGKYKETRLDDIKHKSAGGYLFTSCEEPIHLAEELVIIDEAISRAATKLAMHNCKKFVIASDHGASRLAVIKKQEEKYQTDTKGEHSGRCCKFFEGCDLPYYISENNYLVLSDYGRFKGSREANVEVHGGATLEEVIVPIITLTLKNQMQVDIQVLYKDDIVLIKNKGVVLHLYISDISYLNNVKLIMNDMIYIGIPVDSHHINFNLTDIKRAKNYSAEIFDGEDLIGKIEFTVKGKTGSINNDFDSLF